MLSVTTSWTFVNENSCDCQRVFLRSNARPVHPLQHGQTCTAPYIDKGAISRNVKMSRTYLIDTDLFDYGRRLTCGRQRLELEGRGKEGTLMDVHQMATS